MSSFSLRRSIGIAAVLAAIGALLLALLGPVQPVQAYPTHRVQLVASAQASAGTVEALIAQCPSSAEVAAFNTDLSITFEADPTAGTLVCQASNGSADLTRLQERTYQALRVMKAIHFSRPLPWTSQNLYDWFVSSIHGIRFRSDIATSFCCDPANVLNILVGSNFAALATNRWIDPSSGVGLDGLVALFVHEARHNNGYPHTCDYDPAVGGFINDQTVGELGAWGAQYYLNLWEGLYSGSFLTAPDPTPGTLGVTAFPGCLVLRVPCRYWCLFYRVQRPVTGMLNCPVAPGLAAVPRAACPARRGRFLLSCRCSCWSGVIRRAGTG